MKMSDVPHMRENETVTDQHDEKVDQVSEPTGTSGLTEYTGDTSSDSTTASSGDKDLLPAAESSDPAVQALLAEREAAVSNKNEDAAKDVARRLAELGYE